VAVGLVVGVVVVLPVTSIVPSIPPWAWQTKVYVPGALKLQ